MTSSTSFHCAGMGRLLVFVLLVHGVVSFNDFYGVNYNTRKGGDKDPNRCKSQTEIDQDLKAMALITKRLRIGSLTDCYQGKMVLRAAKKTGMQVWLGLWVNDIPSVFELEKDELIKLIDENLIDSSVLGISIGNEAVYRDDIKPHAIAGYVNEVRNIFLSKNINIKISIVDIVDTYIKYPELIDVVDIITVNVFPFWERIDIDSSVAHFKERIKPLYAAANGKECIISETGWASGGRHTASSTASTENAQKYLRNFYCLAQEKRLPYFYFTAFDEPWKTNYAGMRNSVEAHFGVLSPLRLPQPWVRNLSFNCNINGTNIFVSEWNGDNKKSSSRGGNNSSVRTIRPNRINIPTNRPRVDAQPPEGSTSTLNSTTPLKNTSGARNGSNINETLDNSEVSDINSQEGVPPPDKRFQTVYSLSPDQISITTYPPEAADGAEGETSAGAPVAVISLLQNGLPLLLLQMLLFHL